MVTLVLLTQGFSVSAKSGNKAKRDGTMHICTSFFHQDGMQAGGSLLLLMHRL